MKKNNQNNKKRKEKYIIPVPFCARVTPEGYTNPGANF